jgi:hypothetical protein
MDIINIPLIFPHPMKFNLHITHNYFDPHLFASILCDYFGINNNHIKNVLNFFSYNNSNNNLQFIKLWAPFSSFLECKILIIPNYFHVLENFYILVVLAIIAISKPMFINKNNKIEETIIYQQL